MARKGTIGYQARQLRLKGERRIARLKESLATGNITQATREWTKQQIKEIQSAIQGTRQYSKEGKRYKSKSASYIKSQMERLEREVSKVPARYRTVGDTFKVTQNELNRASVGLPSRYTKQEASIFYRATQKIWQREGIGEHDRNVAIFDYYNQRLREQGLSPLTFQQIVDAIMEMNKVAIRQQDLSPRSQMTEEQREMFERLAANDMGDNEHKSPSSDVSQTVIDSIRDALDELYME